MRQSKPLFTHLISITLVLATAACWADEPIKEKGRKHERPAFSELDLDANNELSFEEFEQHELPRGEHSEVFQRIDSDGDGIITEQEWQSHKPRRKRRDD